MDNRQYLDTLVACGRLNLDRELIEKLVDLPIELRGYINRLSKCFENKGGEKLILIGIMNVLKNCNKEVEEYLKDYERFVRVYGNVFGVKDIKVLLEMEIRSNLKPLGGFDRWKLQMCSNGVKNKKIWINGKEEKIRLEGLVCLDVLSDTENIYKISLGQEQNIGGIFFKEVDGNIVSEIVKIQDKDDTMKVLKMAFGGKYKYDLGILAEFGSYFDNWKYYRDYIRKYPDTSVGEILDILARTRDWDFSDELDCDDLERSYRVIKEEDLMIDGLLMLALYNTETSLMIYNVLVKKLKELGDESKVRDYINKVNDIIETKMKYISYTRESLKAYEIVKNVDLNNTLDKMIENLRSDVLSRIDVIYKIKDIEKLRNELKGMYIAIDKDGSSRITKYKHEGVVSVKID